jgi:ribosomal protein S12 methylthiotransferase
VRVGLINLGCAKNLVDAEIIIGSLLQHGVDITSNPAEADVMIVNTCSFIDTAQEESVDAILQSDALRAATNRRQALIVAGCLPQRFGKELPKLLPEVDLFMGIDQVTKVGDFVRLALANRQNRLREENVNHPTAPPKPTLPKRPAAGDKFPARPARGKSGGGRGSEPVTPGHPAFARPSLPKPMVDVHARPRFIPDFATPRFRLTPSHFAYVKIAEGCNHPCTFCIIPRMRGSHRSRTQSDVVKEVRQLVAEGVREINLISQDSTYYGLDLRPRHRPNIAAPAPFQAATRDLPSQATTLCTLLRELEAVPGDFWIRLLYTHPAHWTDELIQTIAECPKVARYVDIPLQHIHPLMLERMRRETSPSYIVALLARIRAGIPGIALRTTFIVGFPGETPTCFNALLEFIRETRFERLGVFTYSQENGTLAGKMESQVLDSVKRKRRNLAMAAQQQIATEHSQSFVGRTVKVLVEREAHDRELRQAQIQSWEHGLIRDPRAPAERLSGRFLVARGEVDAPDIDGRVYVRGRLPLGEFARVRVVGHTVYDLIAEPEP